jgi:hypothetical protein
MYENLQSNVHIIRTLDLEAVEFNRSLTRNKSKDLWLPSKK